MKSWAICIWGGCSSANSTERAILLVPRDAGLVEIGLFQCLIAAMTLESDVGPRQARKHLSDADRGLGKVGPQSVAERPDARFACGVGRRFRHKPERADRTHVDDSPKFRSIISGTTARVTRTIPVRLTSRMLVQSSAGPREVGAPANVVARVVDENVDRPEIRRNRFEKPIDSGMIRHIELEGKRKWTKRPGQLCHGLVVDVRERNMRATLYERGRDRPAYSASAPVTRALRPPSAVIGTTSQSKFDQAARDFSSHVRRSNSCRKS